MKIERDNAKKQKERMETLKDLYDTMNIKNLVTERENDKLVSRLAENTLCIQTFEDTIISLEAELQEVEAFKDRLLNENQELKKEKKALMKKVSEKEEESAKVNRVVDFFNLDKNMISQPSKLISLLVLISIRRGKPRGHSCDGTEKEGSRLKDQRFLQEMVQGTR